MKFFTLIHVLTYLLLSGVQGQNVTLLPSNDTVFADLFWQLHNLEGQRPRGNPYLGGQNFTWCCLKAFENALDVTNNGTVVIRNSSRSTIGVHSLADLQSAAARSQFPCGAEYNGDAQGAPVVAIGYGFLVEQCPGWELSSYNTRNTSSNLLTGFSLPAVMSFMFEARGRDLHIFSSLKFFIAPLAGNGIKRYVRALLGFLATALIVFLDMTIWVSMWFAFAGPMIISGLHEAMLDNRVLNFLREKIQNKRLTLDMRYRCLMLVLLGSLELELEPDSIPGQRGSKTQSLSLSVTASSSRPNAMANAVPVPQGHEQPAEILGSSASALTNEDQPLLETRPDLLAPGAPPPYGATTSSPEHNAAHRETTTGETTTLSLRQSLAACNSQFPQPGTTTGEVSTIPQRPTAHMAASPWRHMEALLYDLRLYDDDDDNRRESPCQYAPRCSCGARNCGNDRHEDRRHLWALDTKDHIALTKTRLQTMFQYQYSFSPVVGGAPVIFTFGALSFLLGFVVSLKYLGDKSLAEALAFGSWYMILSHVAVVRTLLLGGNNPNILEDVLASEKKGYRPYSRSPDTTPLLFGLLRREPISPNRPKVVWQWQRGHNKKQWINQLLRTYRGGCRVDVDVDTDANINYMHTVEQHDADDDLEDLRAKTNLSALDWFLLLSLTLLLLGVPFVLAFSTAFFTPQAGLSCRSLTLIVYFCMQVGQVALFAWAYAGANDVARVVDGYDGGDGARRRRRGFHPVDFFRRGGWLDTNGFYNPISVKWLLTENGRKKTVWEVIRSGELWSFRAVSSGIFYFLVVLFGLGAVFSGLGGPLMQIMGVYRTAICYINVQHWLAPTDRKPMAILSTNSEEMIRNSAVHWPPCAITAIVFVLCVSFIGCWYQRRMRHTFTQLVHKSENPEFDRLDTRRARRHLET